MYTVTLLAVSAMANVDAYIFLKHTRQGARQCDRRFSLVYYTVLIF